MRLFFVAGRKFTEKTLITPNKYIELTLDLISCAVSRIKRYLLIFTYIFNTFLMTIKKQSIAYKFFFLC